MQRLLTMAIEKRASTAAIFDGSVPAPGGLEVQVIDAAPVNVTFAKMVCERRFDICELGITTYFLARAHGCPVAALPVFPAAYYPHAAVECALPSGIKSPGNLSGTRVGLRSFTAPSAVWARGVLSRQFGVDCASIEWVVSGPDAVPDLALPPNVTLSTGAEVRAMLHAGDLQAGIGLGAGTENAYPLWPDTGPAEREWLAMVGGPPLNHTLVVREELLSQPGLPGSLLAWFRAAQLAAGGRSAPDPATPRGPAINSANRASLQTLLELTREQLPGETGLPRRAEDTFVDVATRSEA